MKYILVIGDGMADHPLDTLGGRTPLEASKKDAIDALARHGILGSVRNVPEGFAPGSDTAIMSIFGCSPRKYFFGRAPLEAAASAYGENAIFRLSIVLVPPLAFPASFWPQPAIRPSTRTRDSIIATTFFMYIPSRFFLSVGRRHKKLAYAALHIPYLMTGRR